MRSGEGKICAAVLLTMVGAPALGQATAGRAARATPSTGSAPASPAPVAAPARGAPKPAGGPRLAKATAPTVAPPAAAGVAPPAPAGAAPQPIGRVADWFPADSYPPQARAKSQEGQTVYAIDLDALGRILRCNIVQSSGSDLLDSTTCTQVISNGRFRPARDAAGKPVPGRFQGSMRWKLVEGAASE